MKTYYFLLCSLQHKLRNCDIKISFSYLHLYKNVIFKRKIQWSIWIPFENKMLEDWSVLFSGGKNTIIIRLKTRSEKRKLDRSPLRNTMKPVLTLCPTSILGAHYYSHEGHARSGVDILNAIEILQSWPSIHVSFTYFHF